MDSTRDECDENGRAMARCERQKNNGIICGIFVPVNAPARRPPGRQRDAFKKALGPQQTKGSAEANLASGKRVENSVPYGSQFDFICWALEDTGLDREFARLGRLSARHS
jgi:hypothetical protein